MDFDFFWVLLIGLIFGLLACESKEDTTLVKISSSQSNIHFSNTLVEDNEFNIIQYLYYYNGGGVAAGDINNDGLVDLYFSSNQGSNKLYLNKGDFKFEDITENSNTSGLGNWKTGVTMADINGDGFLDLFICGVGGYKKFNGRNQLLISNGDLTFTDRTEEYGLAFQGFSTHASFFDFDNDGDLDMYLLNHSVHTARSYGNASLRFQSDSKAGDRLYRNELIPDGINQFADVTNNAGILSSQIGYGLGLGVSDLNRDGYLDIYVANDFHENDYLYINKRDGTFEQMLEKSIPHSSRFSMGTDIADINNDGWMDILTLDMLPKSEKVIKTTAGDDPYDIFEFKLRYGYHFQFTRNSLQLNRGVDVNNNLFFSDVAALAGVEATDWSWASLLADFNNDGRKDIFIANGIKRRPNDMDYINFISGDSMQREIADDKLIRRMPSGAVTNKLFLNDDDLSFKDVSTQWIGTKPSLSNGAAYADLDNDGDLDLIVNNIDEKATVYRNAFPSKEKHFLKVAFQGISSNSFGVGTRIILYAGQKKFYQEQIPSRGWQSSVDYTMHFGLGDVSIIDSLQVIWPGGKFQTLQSLSTDRTITLKQTEAQKDWNFNLASKGIFKQDKKQVTDVHQENYFVAFNVERLMPRMVSNEGPKISIGDINGDKLDDFFIGGGAGQGGRIFFQRRSGDFELQNQPSLKADSLSEDTASLIVDADGNGSADLLVVSGGQEFTDSNERLLMRLYLNDGNGNLIRKENNIPEIYINASCIKAADIDNDGDPDLFVGGRVISGHYGYNPPSFVLENNGKGVFIDKSSVRLPHSNLGMVTDAEWTDLNADRRLDLVVVGEWMPITVLIQNEQGVLQDKTKEYGLDKTNGWWNCLLANDIDSDGDIDFLVGNIGVNSRLRANKDEPIGLFVTDIDQNGSDDPILTYYNDGQRYPFISRDQLIKQVPSLKRKFLRYKDFENVSLEDIIPSDQMRNAIKKEAFLFSSVLLINNGITNFSMKPLPIETQFAPVFSFLVDDVDLDGNKDILAVGNLYAVQPDFGRYDAGYGTLMLGNGVGDFEATSIQTSGFIVNGEGRDVKLITNLKKEKLYLVSRNNDSLLIFKRKY